MLVSYLYGTSEGHQQSQSEVRSLGPGFDLIQRLNPLSTLPNTKQRIESRIYLQQNQVHLAYTRFLLGRVYQSFNRNLIFNVVQSHVLSCNPLNNIFGKLRKIPEKISVVVPILVQLRSVCKQLCYKNTLVRMFSWEFYENSKAVISQNIKRRLTSKSYTFILQQISFSFFFVAVC